MKELGDASYLPEEVTKALAKSDKIREKTILKQIALVEMGASQYYTERSMMDDFGITFDQIQKLKAYKRSEIDSYKRGFEEGKYRISSEINERLKLTEAMRMAVATGDDKAFKEIKGLLADLEKFAPIKLIEQMWGVMEKINKSDNPTPSSSSTPNNSVNIQINSSMAEAERLIAERKKLPLESTPVPEEKFKV